MTIALAGAEVTGTVYPDYLRILYDSGTRFTPDHELRGVRPHGATLTVTLANTYTDQLTERAVDQVIVENGTLPMDDLYQELRPHAHNDGKTDLTALLNSDRQPDPRRPGARFQLYLIGDALAHRNIHAAIYDARRLLLTL